MANKYVTGAGATLKYGTVGSAPTTALGNIDSFGDLPSLSAEEFETTRIDQVLSGGGIDWTKQFEAGFIDPGTMKVTIGFDKTLLATVYPLIRTAKAWLISFADGTTLAFNGWIKDIKPTLDKKGEVKYELTIRVSGGHTLTPAV